MSIDEINLKVNGMHCGSCVFAVENGIMDLDGVEEAKADLNTGMVQIKYDVDRVSLTDIDKAVRETGFTIEIE